jgi:hypothetical protein
MVVFWDAVTNCPSSRNPSTDDPTWPPSSVGFPRRELKIVDEQTMSLFID